MRIWCKIKIKNFFLISLSILINCLPENLWISLGEVICWSLLGVKGFTANIGEIRYISSPLKEKEADFLFKDRLYFLIFLFSTLDCLGSPSEAIFSD